VALSNSEYDAFIAAKILTAPQCGIEDPPALHSRAFPFQRDLTRWALRLGRAALFEDTGLGKTLQVLEWSRIIAEETELPVLILTPLAVAQNFVDEGAKLGIEVHRPVVLLKPGVNVSNYQRIDKFDGQRVGGIVLDESSILKNFEGKTRNRLIERFADVPFKLAATATPSPNDHSELGNHAEFLGVMQRSVMLAQFFTHDGGDTSKWRLKRHGVGAFWKWVSSWAALVRNPRDLGYDAAGYDLPPIEYHEHTATFGADQRAALVEKSDAKQLGLFIEARTLADQRNARRLSLDERCNLAAMIADAYPDEPLVIWCDLNDESEKLAKLIPGAVEIRGETSKSDLDEREARILGFAKGDYRVMVTKPSICGFGLNWQHCARMAFVGGSHSFETVYQAERRCHRFGQTRPVHVHCITSEAEGRIVENLKSKRAAALHMAEEMASLSREYVRENITGWRRPVSKYEPAMRWELPTWAS
jgi:hypothetical protein